MRCAYEIANIVHGWFIVCCMHIRKEQGEKIGYTFVFYDGLLAIITCIMFIKSKPTMFLRD